MAQPQPCGDDDTGICPHCGSPLTEESRWHLEAVEAALDPVNAVKLSPEESTRRHNARMQREGTVPTLADYRRCYDNLTEKHDAPHVSDEEIRRRHLVAG